MTRGECKAASFFGCVALAAFFMYGGDRPEDRVLHHAEAQGQAPAAVVGRPERPSAARERTLRAPALAAPLDCQKLRDRAWLRWQVTHIYAPDRRGRRDFTIECAYGPVWLEVAREVGM